MATNKGKQKITGKEDLVHLMADKAKLTMRETHAVLDAFLQTVLEEVAQGHQVRLIGFGSWQQRPVSARTIRSIRGGATVQLPAGKRVTFTTGSQLAQAAKQPKRVAQEAPAARARATTKSTKKRS